MNKLISLDDLKIYDREKNNHIGFDLYDEVSSDSGVFTITDAGDYNLRNLEIYEGNERIVSFTPEPFYNSAENYQVSVSGKNMFPILSEANLTLMNKPTGGTRYGYVFEVTEPVTIKVNDTSASLLNVYYGTIDDTNTYTQKALLLNTSGVVTARTLTASGRYCIYPANDTLNHALRLNNFAIQLESGATATDYEPYNGVSYTLTPNDYETVFDNIMTKSNPCNINIAKDNVGVKSTICYRKNNEVNDVLQTIRNQRLPLGGETGQRLETNENGKMEWRNV